MKSVFQSIFWFLGTARAAVVVIFGMIIAFCTESQEAVDNFLENGCHPGTEGCTSATLTNIQNAQGPDWGPPTLSFDYEYKCSDEANAGLDVCSSGSLKCFIYKNSIFR